MSQTTRECAWCSRPFICRLAPSCVARGEGKYCSKVCSMKGTLTGKPSRNWRGGRTIKPGGYVLVHMPSHPNANASGRVLEHRLVMEQVLGRYLDRREVVHHLNGDPSDNSPDNLSVMTQSEHMRLHGQLKRDALEWRWYMEA